MSLEASSLTIQVVSQGVVDATKALLDLADAGAKAEASTSKIGSGAKAAAQTVSDAASSSASVQVDAAQKAASSYNATIDFMTEKAKQYYGNQSIMAQKEVFDGMAMMDKLRASSEGYYADLAAKRAKDTQDVLSKQQKQMDAAKALYASQQEMANKMNSAFDKQKAADGQAFTDMLKRQADTIGMTSEQLRNYTAEQLKAKAAQLGVSDQTKDYITKLQSAKGAHEGMSLATAGSARELMVLGHEMATGQINRFLGSLIVLGERINFLPAVFSGLGTVAESIGVSFGVLLAAIGAVVVVTTAAIIVWNKSATALREMKDAVVMTGGSAGATGDALYDMANKVGEATGKFGMARESVLSLANTGRFTSDQIGLIATAAVGMEKYAGASIESTTAMFVKLAAEPLKAADKGFKGVSDAAMQLDQQLHFLEPSVLAEIMHLERMGDAAGASKVAINALGQEETKRVEELKKNLTPLGQLLEEISEAASKMWDNLFHKQSKGDELKGLQDLYATYKNSSSFSNFLEGRDMDAIKKRIDTLQNDILQGDFDAAKKAHDVRMNNETNLALVQIRNINQKAKSEQRADQETAAYEKALKSARDRAAVDPKFAAEAGDLISPEAEQAMLAYIQKSANLRQKAQKSVGLSDLDSTLAQLNEQYELQKQANDNEIKLIDFKQQHALMSDSAAQAAKDKLLNQELADQQTVLEKELAAINAFHTSDVRLTNDAATKKANIEKQLGLVKGSIQLKKDENNLLPDSYDAKAQQAADQQAVQVISQVNAQTQAVQAKIDAYNSLSDAVKAQGITEKQMQDEITEAEIKALQAKIDSISGFGDASGQEIIRLTAEKKALEDRAQAQKAWEQIQSRNSAALNAPAALKQVATEQVKLWKDAGNEIEKSLTSAFGNAGQAAGKMFKAFAEGQARQIDITEKIREVNANKSLDEQTKAKQINDLQLQGAQAQLGSYGQMADAASLFFDKGSSGYQAMTKAAQILHTAEVALSLIKGVNAVLTQGEGDPYTAFARMAAMTALVAGLGVALSGGGSGGAMSSADQQKIQGTGSVLGSPTVTSGNKVELVGAKSDSITHSLTIMEKTSGLGLAVNNDMLMALQKLNTNISSFATQLVKSTNITNPDINLSSNNGGATTAMEAILGGGVGLLISKAIPVVGNVIGKIATAIFGGKQTLADSGVTIGSGSLGSVLANGVNAQSYANITTSGGLFKSDKTNTQTSSLGADANKQITLVVQSMTDTIKTAAKSLGLDGAAFSSNLNNFVVDIGNISLKGLSGDQVTAALNNVFSKLGDQMASFAFSDLTQFQQNGEGMLETVARVAEDFSKVNDVFKVLSKTLPEGLQGIAQAEKLVASFGSSDALTSAVKAYEDAIYTDNEKLAPVIKSVQDSLDSMGLSSVQTKEDFELVVNSLDLTSDSGITMFNKLMAIAPQFGQAIDGVAKSNQTTTDAIQSTIDKLKDFSASILKFRNGLNLSESSPLTPAQKLADAASQFQTTIQKAMAGDSTAQGNVTDIAQSYLDAAKTYYASSDPYTGIFNQVQQQLAAVEKFADNGVSAAETQMNVMTNQLSSLQSISTTSTEILNALNNLVSGSTPAAVATQSGASNAELVTAIKTLTGTVVTTSADTQSSLNNVAGAVIDSNAENADSTVSGITKALAGKTSTARFPIQER